MRIPIAISTLLALPALAAPSEHAEPCPEPKLGAVASESDICSRVGTDLLKAGGNAADAMVGTVLCVGVVGMYHSGLGGGGFMVIRSPDGTYEAVDFREKAPAAAFEEMYNNNTEASISGGLASGVPGELRGMEYLHGKYGKLPWRDVVWPAVHIARYGWTVNEDLVSYIESAEAEEYMVNDPTWALDFAPNGTIVKQGDTIRRKRLANTLETIAEEGADAFYTGAIAQATIDALQKENGTMTMQDLADYEVEIRAISQIDYKGYKVTSSSAPSSGAVGLSILNIFGEFEDAGDPAEIKLTTHRFVEAMRFGYGMRTNLGDPLFVEGLADYEKSMLTKETAREVRGKISDTTSYGVEYYNPNGTESLDTPGTAHMVAADADGLVISLTSTINLLFGSELMIPETGVIMNNEMNVSCALQRGVYPSFLRLTYIGLLHPRRLQRLWLRSLAFQLRPAWQAAAIFDNPGHR